MDASGLVRALLWFGCGYLLCHVPQFTACQLPIGDHPGKKTGNHESTGNLSRRFRLHMWKPYLKVIAAEAGQALHVLDRFHITSHLNQAVDQVRRAESTRLGAKSKKAAQRLKHMRWPLLRRGSRVRGRARQKLNALLASKLATARAWDLKEAFSYFWKYKSVIWAGGFLDYWCFRAMRSRLEPMKKVARMLRAHEPLILNWFRAKGEISNGAVEGLNNKIRVVTRRSYGFRTFEAMELALYHNLGRLPEPESPHRFC